MRGGAQAHLLRCDDGHFYVVKFRNNPQHLRVLANDFLVTRLAERVGLPVPATEIVDVGPWLVEHTPELNIMLGCNAIPCEPGLQFGSRYVISPLEGQVFDYLAPELFERVRNLETFAGMLVVDKWTVQFQWTAGHLLAAPDRTQVHGQFHRPRVLLQCRRVDVS
jgi:hypothetical protein